MRADQFYESRRDEWRRLEKLLAQCQKDIRQLAAAQVEELGSLYRAAASDLAVAQRDFPAHRVTAYVNQLVARAHAIIYQNEPLAFQRLRHFVVAGFPGAFRAALPFIVAAMLMFVLPAVLAGISTAWNPASARWWLPSDAHNLIPMIEEQSLWTDIPIKERPYASSFIMQNNIQVAFLAFGSGILGCLPTVGIMISNGLLIGGITGLTVHYRVGFDLWTFVIGHGVIELGMIFIAGGSGLMLGWAVIWPGLLSRRDALALAGRNAVRLVVGCVPLLIVAGLIEGFISPAEQIPWFVKWGIGLFSGVLVYGYLLFSGRTRLQRSPHA